MLNQDSSLKGQVGKQSNELVDSCMSAYSNGISLDPLDSVNEGSSNSGI